jgi:hypothetical protein
MVDTRADQHGKRAGDPWGGNTGAHDDHGRGHRAGALAELLPSQDGPAQRLC